MTGSYAIIFKVTTLVAVAALAGCGGSNDGSATNPITEVNDGLTILKTYSDGSGFVGFRQTVNGTQYSGTILGGDVATTSYASFGTANLDNVVSIQSTAKGEYSSAIATIDNVQRQVYVYEANNGEASYMVGDSCIGPCIGAYGVAPTDIPSGTWVYSGDFIALGEGGNLSDSETGTFTMSANFTSETADFSASSPNGKLVFSSNNATINTSTGTFNGTGSAISPGSAGGSGNEWDIDLYGSFHGAGATSVSGVASSNLQTVTGPDNLVGHVNGAFAGSLTP